MGLLLCVCCNVYLVQCVCKSRRICGTHSCEEFLSKGFDADRNVPIAECSVQQLRMRTEAGFPVMHITTVTDMTLGLTELVARLSDGCAGPHGEAARLPRGCPMALGYGLPPCNNNVSVLGLLQTSLPFACSLDPRATAQIVMLGGMSGCRLC